MFRLVIPTLALATVCCAETFPAFRWIQKLEGAGMELAGLGTDSRGNIYLAGTKRPPGVDPARGSDVFVARLDPAGNILYSTLVGGSAGETATAMTVDPAGNVYVAGTTGSNDFPTTPGAYAPAAPPVTAGQPFLTFLFRLNPDGSVGYATYFSNSATLPNAIAVDSAGSVYLTGVSYGGLQTTAGAYRTSCACIFIPPPFGAASMNDAFLARFDAAGSRLIFATYIGAAVIPNAIALAPDGSAYIAGYASSVYRLDASGSALLATGDAGVNAQTMAVAPDDGTLYLAGFAGDRFRATSGAFQGISALKADQPPVAPGQSAIVRMDGQLQNILAGTYFGGAYGSPVRVMTLGGGNVYFGGYTSPRSLPTRTPFVQGFGQGITGYAAELTGDLSTLLFSSEFGDNEAFGVNGIAIGADGNVVLGGTTGLPDQNVWVNSLSLAPPSALRIDAVQAAATGLTDPVSPGETIVVSGAGFGADSRVLVGGVAATLASITPGSITATAPSGIAGPATTVQVLSGGAASNSVTVAVPAGF